MNKRTVAIITLLCCLFVFAKQGFSLIDNPVEGVDSINADETPFNYLNKTVQFYYYIPAAILKDKSINYPLLIVVPGLSGKGEAAVGGELKKFADEEGFTILAPSFVFDQRNWADRRSYQFPDVWSGDALLKAIKKLKDSNNLKISMFYLFGHSAGAQFSLRFCLWRAELCRACAAHASGGTVTPQDYVKVKFFVTVGEEDTTRIPKAEYFYDQARRHGIDVTIKLYDTDHSLTSYQIRDSIAFFKRVHSLGQDELAK